MAKTVEEVTDEAIKQGGLLVNLFFDMHGNSKEVIQNSLVEMIAKLTQEHGVLYATGVVEEPIEMGGLYSTSAEVKLLAMDFNTMVNVSLKYGPIGLEIMRPNNIKLSVREAQDVLINISQTAQEYSNYIVNKVMTEEERIAFKRQLYNKSQLVKKWMEKSK